MKKISVIIPGYNVEKYLPECLNSVVNQSLRELEIICINDGSTDKTNEILQDYQKKDNRIIVLQGEHNGVSHARNLGLKEANGEYLYFMDADDYLELNALEYVYQKAQEQQSDIVVFGGVVECKSDSVPIWICNCISPRNFTYCNHSLQSLFYESGSRPFAWNKLYKRSLFIDNEIFFFEDLHIAEDHMLQLMIFPIAERISFVDRKLYHYRYGREGAATENLSQEVEKRCIQHTYAFSLVSMQWIKRGYFDGSKFYYLQWALQFLYDDLSFSGESIQREQAGKIVKVLSDIGIKEQIKYLTKCDKILLNNIYSYAEGKEVLYSDRNVLRSHLYGPAALGQKKEGPISRRIRVFREQGIPYTLFCFRLKFGR